MQRLELQNGRELRGSTQLVGDDVRGDFGGKRQRESHRSEDDNKGARGVNLPPPVHSREKRVIPRLAQRAEGPLRRSIASAKCSASTSERTLRVACVTEV